MSIIFITGATSGFGLAATHRFITEGWRVIATGRNAGVLQDLKKEYRDAIHCSVFDIRDKVAVNAAVESLPETWRSIDVLLNNAGLSHFFAPIQEGDVDDWDMTIDVNIKGLLYCTRAILPAMLERGSGHVINLGSIGGSHPFPNGNVYASSKAFVNFLSRCMRADLAGTPLRMTSVEPGMAQTNFFLTRFKGDRDAEAATFSGMQPLTADDVAETIYWIATRPAHMNVESIELLAVDQSYGPFTVHRRT